MKSMRKRWQKIVVFILILPIALFSLGATAFADLPVVDFVNAALNELRNTLMQDQFTQQIVIFFDQLNELQNSYQEMIRFNSGLEEFIRSFIQDASGSLKVSEPNLREDYLAGFEPSIEQGAIRNMGNILEGSGDPSQIRTYMEVINGSDPQSLARPYITFDESQIGAAYLLAHEIRKNSDATKAIGEAIQDQAGSASPKGAARLTADAMGKMVVMNEETQGILAKLLELEATGLEQTSRDEKRVERERLKYTDEMKLAVETLGRPM